MDIVERIKNNFNKGFFDKAMPIEEMPDKFPAWTIKSNSWIGVAVPTENYTPFTEHFSNVKLWTAENVSIDDNEYNLLMLTCSEMDLRNEFAIICSQFIQPGVNGTDRENIVSSPDTWWRRWKNLLGNMNGDKEPYPVLGELIALEYLLKNGETPTWSGAEQATHDLETNTDSYEVKSTIMRYNYEVTINSIYQMDKTGRSLKLLFFRFEKSNLGTSIDEIVNRIISMGYPEEKIEKALKNHQLEKGCVARTLKYKVLESKQYNVDENFPAITMSSFKNDMLPKHITRITYTVDLSGVSGENIK